MLMSDCGSEISVGAEKYNLLTCDCCAYLCLTIAVQAAMKNPAIQEYLCKLYLQSSVKFWRETIFCNLLLGQNDGAKKQGDHSSTNVLAWWSKMRERPLKVQIGLGVDCVRKHQVLYLSVPSRKQG